MRRFVLAIVLLSLGIGESSAAGAPPLPPGRSDQPAQAGLAAHSGPAGVGQLLVADPKTGAVVRLNLARYHVNVVLDPPVALVQIDQSFFNPHPVRQEGTFAFNLPDGASVCRFAMFSSPTQLVEGELIDRAKAANVYQAIGTQRDPQLLEQLGGNLFRMRVFPVPASDAKRILLDYTVPLVNGPLLDRNGGGYSFELPLMSELEPIADFAITGTIRGPIVAGTARSSSHAAVKFEPADEGSLRFELRQTAFSETAPLTVQFQQQQKDEVTIRSYVAPQADAAQKQALDKDKPAERPCEFLATISPEVLNKNGPPANAATSPVDVLILADTSAANIHRQELRKAVRSIADALRKTDRFQLGCVDVNYRPLSKDWIEPQSAAAEELIAGFEQELFLGACDFETSFKSAFGALPVPEAGRRRWIIYVGDGTLPAGKATPADIHKALAPAVKDNVRFGAVLLARDDAGRQLMERLAATTGGRTFVSGRSREQAEPLEWLAAGCPDPIKIVEVQAEGVAADDLFVPPSWVPGSALYVHGRLKSAGRFPLTLAIERDGRRETFEWPLEARSSANDYFAGRLWGQKKLDQIRVLERGNPKAADARDRQVALSQEWTLLSPHTAFVVLEDETEHAKYGVLRSLRRIYWDPETPVAAAPLPAGFIITIGKQAPKKFPVTANQFAAALASARAALKNSAPSSALAALRSVEKSSLAETSREFSVMRDMARQSMARGELFASLGPQRAWFDRTRPVGFPTGTGDLVWQFVYGYRPGNADEGRALNALSKKVSPPKPQMEFEEFTDWLRDASGLNVVLDKQTLTDEGIDLTQDVDLHGVRFMSLQNLLEIVLTPLQLTTSFEEGVLKITTATRVGERLATRLYPVRDLLLSTEPTDMSLLADAELDDNLLVTRRMQNALDQKINVEFVDLALEDALDFIGIRIDENLWIDRQTLTDEGVAVDQPVTLRLKDLPARGVLKELLEPVQLTMVVENETIKITTSVKAGEKLTTHIHAAQGLVHELPHELRQTLPRAKWRGQKPPGGFGGPGGQLEALTDMAGISEQLVPGDADAADVPRQSPGIAFPIAGDFDEREGVSAASKTNKPGETTDAQEIIDIVTSTVAADSWEDLSGPGSIIYSAGSQGFIVRQTKSVDEEVARLFEQMRALPPAFGEQSFRQPAAPNLVGANNVANWDTRELINVLTTIVQPDMWEDLSGPGSMYLQKSKLNLFVRQTPAVHREVQSLLCTLRRARYLARRGVVWKSFDIFTGPDFPIAFGITELPANPALSDVSAAEPQELKALEVLAEPLAGIQSWRSIPASSGGTSSVTILRRSAQRSEFEFDGRVARTEGDEAAIAYPGLTLVERGAWSAELRRLMDGRLPWLPHRTRRELAQMFAISVTGQDQKTTQLKFALPKGTPGDEIAVTVDRKTGLPTLWESRLAGRAVLRLRFEDMKQVNGKPIWGKVAAVDGEGRAIERWELAGFSELKNEIPALDEGWANFAMLDLREQEPADSRPFVQALQTIRSGNWEAVDRALAAALAKQPRQPLISFLKAWNLARRPKREAEIVSLLTDVARSGAADLIRNIADGAFVHLGVPEMQAVLLAIPEKQRDAAVWDLLARLAARSGRLDVAVGHVKAAIVAGGPLADSPERIYNFVQVLLAADQSQAAFQLAQSRVARDNIAAENIPALVDLFLRGGLEAEAKKLVIAALAHPRATDQVRQLLLTRRAGFEPGPARWRTLIEAASLLQDDSNSRAAAVHHVLTEMSEAGETGQAGALAQYTDIAQIAAALWLAQAEHEIQQGNPKGAADIGWKLYETKQLPADKFGWLITHLMAVEQHERVIAAVEERLRSGEPVEVNVLHLSLGKAYEAVGRRDDAKRARTHPQPANNQQPGWRPAGAGGMGGGFF